VFVSGASMMLLLASGNTIIQTLVDDDKRGRVMALFSFALLGTAPFGSLYMGWLAQRVGVSWAMSSSGALCILGGLVYRYKAGGLNAFVPEGRAAAGPVF
jgi:MFS family permease